MYKEDGLQVTLSPVQLAAVVSDASISEGETLSNRLWGGAALIGGLLEMFGAGLMCAAPEPTTVTKVGCVLVGGHSADVINTATSQIMSGRQTNTATYNAAAELAQRLGANKETADNIALTVDLAVPIGFAAFAGAVRVGSIRAGRIKLIEHESSTGLRPGGHTIAKHVGKSKDELLQRLKDTETSKFRPSAASSFTNLDIAEKAISQALRANKLRIEEWVKFHPTTPLVIEKNVGFPAGAYIKRGATELTATSQIKVVLRYESYNGKPYYVLTAFPTW